jgi:hypothetical protein
MSDGFTSEEQLFFDTGVAMEAAMQEDAAAEAWEDEILGAPARRSSRLKSAVRLGMVVAVVGGLFLVGTWLHSSKSPPGAVSGAIAAIFR